MATPQLPPPPATHKDGEQFPGTGSKPGNSPVTGSKCETGNGETAKSTPPASGNDTEATNKRKRGPHDDDGFNDNEEKISTETTRVVDTKDTVETTGVKEVEMKDAEAIDESPDEGIKEVEMQDAEVVYNRATTHTHVEENSRAEGVADVHEENKTHQDVNDHTESNLNESESGKQDQGAKESEKPAKVGESKSNEKQSVHADMSNGSGEEALGEVATLLKQVQESDAKAKLEVEVKVKKMDDGVVKENGEIEKAVQV